MSLNVGDSIPVDVPEPRDPRRLELGKSPHPPARIDAMERVWDVTIKWALPYLFIYLAFVFYWPTAAMFSLAHAALVSRRRRWKRGLLSLAVCPLVVVPLFSFSEGLLDYADATARSRGISSRVGRGSLDPLTRTFPSPSSAAPFGFGYEPFVEAPYNQALGLMVKSFGTLRGHHAGAYPSKSEAFKALTGGRLATWDIEAPLDMNATGFAAWLSERLDILGLSSPHPQLLDRAFVRSHLDLLERDRRLKRRWRLRITERDGLVVFGDERLVFLVSKSSRELFAHYQLDT